VLLDSDIVIEILRGRANIAEGLAATEIQGIPTYCCAITWAEIGAGLRPGEEAATEDFFQARGEVVIDAATGRRAGAYLSRYARSHKVEIADALIAAAASTAGLSLWTLNRKHYPMEDLRLYNPART
jgi:predicted nucleic acid-binding protein